MKKYLVLYLLVALSMLACSGKKEEPDTLAEKVVRVQIAPPQQKMINESIKLTGEITPLYQVDIFSKVNGIVLNEKFEEGARVTKDQLLAEVIQDIPGMEFTPVKIAATADGYITRDWVEIGSKVTTQQPMYTISQLDQVYMQARIIEAYLGKVKTGDRVQVRVEAYTGQDFNGRVSDIGLQVDPLSRTCPLKISINNPGLRLKPGMFAVGYLTTAGHPGMTVPLDAIVRNGINQYVFCVRDGRAVKVMVETGMIGEHWIEVKGALRDEDKVIVLGQDLLDDSQAVEVSEE